ncbi:MAG: tetratricopeptide repeat protein [Pseudomonadota bacterium]
MNTGGEEERVFSLFDAALQLPEHERSAFLLRVSAGNEALHKQVMALLSADAESSSLFDATLGQLSEMLPDPASADDAMVGRAIGPYALIEKIGSGGMGVVYLAERPDVGKRVALKLVAGGLASEDARSRFMLERRVLARLQHSGIAALVDAGVADDTSPWFAMELVEGKPITDYCDDEQLSVTQRLALFEQALEAVAYAHRNLVVHRDLKPSNILVTATGEPKLLDFGIARLVAEDEDESMPLTRTGIAPMTPDFAAPEQILGQTIGPPADVYQLGVLLYELLSGQRPYRLRGHSLGVMERRIVDEVPVRPSVTTTRASVTPAGASMERLAARRRTTPRQLRRCIAGELDAIVMKALAKEPERRYASGQELLDDVRRYRQGHPVAARPDTLRYRTQKFASRHPVSLGFSTVLVLLVVGFVAIYTVRVTAERNLAQIEARKAERVSAFLVDLFTASSPFSTQAERTEAITVNEFMERRASRVVELEDEPEVQLLVLQTVGQMFTSMGEFDQALPLRERALTLASRLHPTPHQEIVASLYGLGEVHRNMGRFTQAEALFHEALKQCQQLGLEHELIASDVFTGLGESLRQQGRLDAAEGHYARALDIRRAAYPDGSPELSVSMNNYALILWRQGRYLEAQPLFRNTLRAYETQLPADHPRVASALHNLGLVQRELGQYDDAETSLEASLAIKRARLGDDHWRVATGLRNLARVKHDRGDLKAAGALFRDALAIQLEALGENHINTYSDRLSLADVMRDRGETARAEAAYDQVLEWMEANLPPDHPQKTLALLGYGSLLLDEGRYTEAAPLLESALAIRRERFGDDHLQVAVIASPLGALRTAEGRFAEAESLLRPSLETLDATCFSPGCADATVQRLVNLYQAWRKPDMARPYLARLGTVSPSQ